MLMYGCSTSLLAKFVLTAAATPTAAAVILVQGKLTVKFSVEFNHVTLRYSRELRP